MVPDDVIWEVIRGFDLINMKILQQAAAIHSTETPVKPKSDALIPKPHPGIVYLLDKLDKFST